MQDHMSPHDHRGRLPYGRTWPHRGSVPAPIQALAEFLIAPARLVQQTIGLSVVAKAMGGVLLVMLVMLGTQTAPISSAPSASPTLAAGIAPPPDPDEITFLILGVDAMQDRGRSDTVLLVRLMLKHKKVHILSIPRDTYAVIEKPGGVIEDKLNHSYRFGGAELTKKTVEQNLGIKVDYYGVVDYDLFRKAIDLIGCVELEVEKRYYYIDRAGGLKVDLFPGKQQLCGDKALQYVRFRHDAMGDEGRIQRQQKFLGQALAKLKDPKVVTYVGFKLPSLLEYVTTDVPSQVAMGLLWKVKDITAKDLSMASVPGDGKLMDTPIHRNRLWFYVMDKERLEKLKTEWFYNPEATQKTAQDVLKEYSRRVPSGLSPTPAATASPVASGAPGAAPAGASPAPTEIAPVLRSPFQPPRTNGHSTPKAPKSGHKTAPGGKAQPGAKPAAPAGGAKPSPAPKASAKPAPKPAAKPSPAAAPSAGAAAPKVPASQAPVAPAQPPAAPAASRAAPATPPAAPFSPEDDPMGRDAVDKALERGPSAPPDPTIDTPLPAGGAPAPAQHPAALPQEEMSPAEQEEQQAMEEAQAPRHPGDTPDPRHPGDTPDPEEPGDPVAAAIQQATSQETER